VRFSQFLLLTLLPWLDKETYGIGGSLPFDSSVFIERITRKVGRST